MNQGGSFEDKAILALERIAVANEELIVLAKGEREITRAVEEAIGTAVCPHCETVNPTIRNEGGTGEMLEFVLAAHCMSCSKTFIAVPQGWVTFKTVDEYQEGRMM